MSTSGTRNAILETDVDRAMDLLPHSGVTGELRMWAASFHGGIREYCTAIKAGQPSGHPAVRWVNSDASHPGTFVWLCDLFSFSPYMVRTLVNKNCAHILKPGQGKKKKETP